MKISIIGACCHDEIVHLDGTVGHSYGGITYNISAFSTLLGPDDIVRPCSKLGEDHYDKLMREFERFTNLDRSGLVCAYGEKLTDVRLVYTAPNRREECIRNKMPPIEVDDLTDALDSDAITINIINGVDISLASLRELRQRYAGLLTMDVHNLIGYFDEKMTMHYRDLPNWREWLAPLNVVQMNEVECAHVLGRPVEDEIPAYEEAVRELCDALGKTDQGPETRMAVITLAARGSVMAYVSAGQILSAHCRARPIESMVDPTGCGDSFSAGLLVNYLTTHDPIRAQAAANIVAGANCEHAGQVSLARVRNAIELVSQFYPDLAAG